MAVTGKEKELGTTYSDLLDTAFCAMTIHPFGSPETLALTLPKLAPTKVCLAIYIKVRSATSHHLLVLNFATIIMSWFVNHSHTQSLY